MFAERFGGRTAGPPAPEAGCSWPCCGPKRTDPFGRGCIPTRTRPLQQLSAAQRPSGTPEPNRPHQRTNAFRFAWASFLPSGGDDTAGRASDGRDAPSLRARLARQKDRVATQSGSSPLRLVRRFWALNRHRREDSQQGRSRKGIDELVTRANMGSGPRARSTASASPWSASQARGTTAPIAAPRRPRP